MKIIKLTKESIPNIDEPINLCLGCFDGLHLGHQYLIKHAIMKGKKSAVFTLDVSPKFIIGNVPNFVCLTSLDDRVEILEKLGVDYVFISHFDDKFRHLTKMEFIESFLKPLHPEKLVVGEDYHFGFNAEGDVELLKQFFNVEVIYFKDEGDKKISAKDIREFIKTGDIKSANELLGRYYSMSGKVIEGLQNGRKLGFPTANIEIDYTYAVPQNGVYIGYATINNVRYKAIISIGTHPTIEGLDRPILEVHIIDYDNNIYNDVIKVEFVERIRPIVKFDSVDELINQLHKDKKLAINNLQ